MTRSEKFACIAVLLLFIVTPVWASGGGDCDDMNCNSFFFSPEVLRNPLEVPFLRTSNVLYFEDQDGKSIGPPDIQAVNQKEWAKYFEGAVPQDDLAFLLYKMKPEEVRNLMASLQGENSALGNEARSLKTSLAKYGHRNRVLASLKYLELAKRVEPTATKASNDAWGQDAPITAATTESTGDLIHVAESALGQSDSFIRERYEFQIIRLLFYDQRYTEVEQYFEKYRNSFPQDSSPKYRFMAFAAGAYYKQKKYGLANYLFSIVFDKAPSLKVSAYLSFHPMEEADWKQTLALAKTIHEREVLWQLLGIYADGMAAINAIYEMNPKSPLLPLLVIREVNIAEEGWAANGDRARNGIGVGNGPEPDDRVVGVTRLARIRAIADAGKTAQPYLWQLAAGHLLALSGDSTAAETYLHQSLKSMPKDPALQSQARVSLLFARVRSMKSIDKGAEPYLAVELRWLAQFNRHGNGGAENAERWTLQYLSGIYRQGGDTMRARMLADSKENGVNFSEFSEDAAYNHTASIDAILDFLRSPSDPFDAYLIQYYDYSVEQLQELKALSFMYQGDLANAVGTFRSAAPTLGMRELAADPFVVHIRDCHDCDAESPHTKYTKIAFAERMQTLAQAAAGKGEAAAAASFELANGYYNMSYYGNSRSFYDTDHSNFGMDSWKTSASKIVLQMDLPEKFYLQAMNLSTDREFKARAAFMAAKTEQNSRYNAGLNAGGPRKYFQMLRESYADTVYYQEVIRECGFFRSYLGR